jgi:cytochrome d ubiquinol oxidase subunit I
MIGFGVFSALLALAALWYTRGGRTPVGRRFGTLALIAVPMPFLANLTGWIFTEMGRQPWVVVPNPTGVQEVRMLTADGVSGIAASNVAISLAVFTLLYGALAVVWFVLIRRGVTAGLPDDAAPAEAADDAAGTPLTFAY